MAQRGAEGNKKLLKAPVARVRTSRLAYRSGMNLSRVACLALVALSAWAFAASGAACGGQAVVESDGEGAGGDGAGPSNSSGGAGASNSSGGAGAPDDPPSVPPQCNCPDAPGYAPCIKPMECCPVVGQCKDPANFNCTGSSKTCP